MKLTPKQKDLLKRLAEKDDGTLRAEDLSPSETAIAIALTRKKLAKMFRKNLGRGSTRLVSITETGSKTLGMPDYGEKQ